MILIWIVLIPIIGGLLCWQFEKFGLGVPRWIALLSMLLVMVLGLYLWSTGDYVLSEALLQQSDWQVEYRALWIERFGISFHLAIDGLSLPLIILSGLIGVMAVGCSWSEIQRNVGFFHLCLLWSLGGVIGVFLAIDLFLFFFFWEVMLVPTYFLIALWGHRSSDGKRDRLYAANKFFIFTQASGLLMLLAILGLVWVHYHATGVFTFDYEALRHTPMSFEVEYILMLGFFIAFAVKLPVLPFHSWLPDAHSQAPTAGSVDLAGLLLKTAAYGLFRFLLPIFPEASHSFAPIAMGLGVAGIIYGAMMAFVQTDIKRLIAYTSVSHMGFVLIGVFSGSILAMQGVMVQMIAHGISASALFILCGMLYERLHTRDMRLMGGLWGKMSYLPFMTLFFVAASLGLPGLGNFVGEFLILIGTYSVSPVITILASTGLILSAVYSLVMIQKAFYGPARSEDPVADLSLREFGLMLTLMVALLWIGLYPQPLLNISAESLGAIKYMSDVTTQKLGQ
jgi:NADH-quinone oxidoreductase subunit M